jgi:hypothetical protein
MEWYGGELLKCPTHLKFFGEDRYMVCGSNDYEYIYYDGRGQRICKDCIKRINLEKENVEKKVQKF